MNLIDRQAAIDTIDGEGATVDPGVKCFFCEHHVAERPFEVYCNIMCKWVNEKDYCAIFELHPVLHNCGTNMGGRKQ